MKNTDWLRNKTVVISGASAGVGKYLAFKLILHYNCKIIAISNNETEMKEFYEKLTEYEQNFEYHIFDASLENSWQSFAEMLKQTNKKVDVIVNCVGELPKFKKFEEYTQKEFTKSLNANFYSAVFSIRHMLPFLKKSAEPAIVNISCLASSLSVEGTSVYSASKSALKSYTQILASELDDKFYVGLVLMGIINSDFYKNQEQDVANMVLKKAMNPRLAAKYILEGMCKKKRRIVVGYKTMALDAVSRLFPSTSIRLLKKWLKYKKVNLLSDSESSAQKQTKE